MNDVKPYQPKHSIRLVTAASLFDGHDASINIMRRILQSSGAEVIHLGHDRSAEEVVNTAIEEDANGIALTSYQGGHLEYFKYMRDLLVERVLVTFRSLAVAVAPFCLMKLKNCRLMVFAEFTIQMMADPWAYRA